MWYLSEEESVQAVSYTHLDVYKRQRQYSSGEMLRTKKFYYLLAVMLFGLIPYLILSPLSQTDVYKRQPGSRDPLYAVRPGGD